MTLPTPESEDLEYFAHWLLAEAAIRSFDPIQWGISYERHLKDFYKQKEFCQSKLNERGFYAYESGSGYPTLGHWYGGPVEKDMVFVWAPGDAAETIVVVTRVDAEMIWCVDPISNKEVYNEIDHWRASALLLPK